MKTLIRVVLICLAHLTGTSITRADTTPPRNQDSAFVNVEGAVNKPGRVHFASSRGITIVTAITRAGGFTYNADPKRVWHIRTNEKGAEAKTVIDLDAIWKGKAEDTQVIRDGDRIVVIGRDVDE